jgi:hypothetical protein
VTVRLTTVKKKKELGLITDATAEKISLVRHGANRQGFRVVKGDGQPQIVQSVLLPAGVELAVLAQQPGYGWINDLDASACKSRGGYTELVYTSRKKFDEDTLTMHSIADSGAIVVAGVIKGDVSASAVSLPADPEATPLVTENRPPLIHTFGDMFFNELESFVGVVQNTLRQSQIDPKTRRDIILNAHDALGKFLTMSLDKLGEMAGKEDWSVESLPLPRNDGGETQMFATKEDMAGFVKSVVEDTMLTQFEAHGIKPVAAKAEDVASTTAVAPPVELTTVLEQIQDLRNVVTGLAEKTDVLGHTLRGNGSQAATEEHTAREREDVRKKWESFQDGVPPDARAGVFSGLLIDPAKWERRLSGIKDRG